MNSSKIFRNTAIILFGTLIFISSNIAAKDLQEPKKEKASTVTLSASNYGRETAKGLVLVDFWAAWCGPCRKMAPILNTIAEEYGDKVKVGKMNVDNYKKFALDNGIQALPTIVVYKEGEEVERITGSVSKERLDDVIAKYSEKGTN